MVLEYKLKAKMAGSVSLALILGMITSLFLADLSPSKAWQIVQPLLSLLCGVAFITACWFNLGAKGRSKAWLLLLVFNVIGLAIIITLKDQSHLPDLAEHGK